MYYYDYLKETWVTFEQITSYNKYQNSWGT